MVCAQMKNGPEKVLHGARLAGEGGGGGWGSNIFQKGVSLSIFVSGVLLLPTRVKVADKVWQE